MKNIGNNILLVLILITLPVISSLSQDFEVYVTNSYPPESYSAPIATLNYSKSILSNNLLIPGYLWSYGCMPTSAGMLLGYYDRNGYSNMLDPNTIASLDNCYWDCSSSDGDLGENPYIASHQGIGGRTNRGHVDDYYISFGNTNRDPVMTGNWNAHSPRDCVADWQGASMYFNNFKVRSGGSWTTQRANDGYTIGLSLPNGQKFYSTTPYQNISNATQDFTNLIDQTHGLHQYVESKGYVVTKCYQQMYTGTSSGFTYSDYVTEIDAGRPVLLMYHGHVVCGFGYDKSTGVNMVNYKDTWDKHDHSIEWGAQLFNGSSYMDFIGAIVLHLHPSPTGPPTCIGCGGPSYPNPPIITDISFSSSDQYVYIEWSPASSGETADYYVIYRCLDNIPMSDDYKVATTDDTFIYDYTYNLIPNETYKYVIAGVSEQGEGGNSDYANITLNPCNTSYLVKKELDSNLSITCGHTNIAKSRISNNSNISINGTALINTSFEVETGSTLIIQ